MLIQDDKMTLNLIEFNWMVYLISVFYFAAKSWITHRVSCENAEHQALAALQTKIYENIDNVMKKALSKC